MQLSLEYNLKSQNLAFGKVASDSRNILAQGEIYPSDKMGRGQGQGKAGVPWYLLELLHPFYFM